ncbi:TetR/AcrR family transcriptional regulator [Imtechella halotolerans]|uniref:TetR family transcriptional regulator n=1 Tax=Imtechella halotolerans K1 TaxID=946077 RepID=I0WJ17_9FLAO|nr:TetR/AcrR family transcriptional regulator [Imtechella halotolerans]EID76383.1 TetR family transcriptional regulator [Imtechella halotolerans K1]WMQ63044.1 TetR/AcrR family transcriptional regulator [Imtechella halotolerans]
MKEKILQYAADKFLSHGFKSVTMDDIASEMGVSKKTLYQHFSNKTALVKETVTFVMSNINCNIDLLRQEGINPISELFKVISLVQHTLKDEKSSPQFQLMKYYPKIYNAVRQEQFFIIEQCIGDNIRRGIQQGIYREDVDISLATRFYFNGMMELKNSDIFSPQQYHMPVLMTSFLEYHVRAIATSKGVKILEDILKERES